MWGKALKSVNRGLKHLILLLEMLAKLWPLTLAPFLFNKCLILFRFVYYSHIYFGHLTFWSKLGTTLSFSSSKEYVFLCLVVCFGKSQIFLLGVFWLSLYTCKYCSYIVHPHPPKLKGCVLKEEKRR